MLLFNLRTSCAIFTKYLSSFTHLLQQQGERMCDSRIGKSSQKSMSQLLLFALATGFDNNPMLAAAHSLSPRSGKR